MILNYQLSVNEYLRAAGTTSSNNKIFSLLNLGLYGYAGSLNLL
jgi:hypothetical protein